MAKSFFRWLRGELNGFYITRIYDALNKGSKDISDFLSEFKSTQFELGKISSKNLYGLGKFAGIFLPRISRSESLASLRTTESFTVGGIEYSERGLFNTELESFSFFHTQKDTASLPDINTLATPEQRSSLVGTEEVIGYISSEETFVLDNEGRVRREKVLATPPVGVAYSDYYGDQFLFLSEAEKTYSNLKPSLYIELFKALQWIRYNGVSIKSLVKVVSIVCPDGLVKLGDIEPSPKGRHWYVYYTYDDTVEVDLKTQRLNLLEFIVSMKFVQIFLVEKS